MEDRGAGIRFNVPVVSPFRPSTWEEWFQNFTRHDLMFVYESDSPDSRRRRATPPWRAGAGSSISPRLIDLVMKGAITPGKVFDLILPLDPVAEGYRAMDERRAIKTLLRP